MTAGEVSCRGGSRTAPTTENRGFMHVRFNNIMEMKPDSGEIFDIPVISKCIFCDFLENT